MKRLVVMAVALSVLGGIVGCGNPDDVPSTTPIPTDKAAAPKEGAGGMQTAPVPSPTPVN